MSARPTVAYLMKRCASFSFDSSEKFFMDKGLVRTITWKAKLSDKYGNVRLTSRWAGFETDEECLEDIKTQVAKAIKASAKKKHTTKPTIKEN